MLTFLSRLSIFLVSQKQEHLSLSLWLAVPQASPQVFSALVSPTKGHIPYPHSQKTGRGCQGLTTGQRYSPYQQAGLGNLLDAKVWTKFFSPCPFSSALFKPWHPHSHHVHNITIEPSLLSCIRLWPILLFEARHQPDVSHSSTTPSTYSMDP